MFDQDGGYEEAATTRLHQPNKDVVWTPPSLNEKFVIFCWDTPSTMMDNNSLDGVWKQEDDMLVVASYYNMKKLMESKSCTQYNNFLCSAEFYEHRSGKMYLLLTKPC